MSSRLHVARHILKGPTARQGYLTAVDQGLVSGTGFITNFLLARSVAQNEYGAFALVLGVILLASFIQMALVTGPLTVVGPKIEGEHADRYLRANLTAQGVLTAAFVAVGLLAALVGAVAGAGTYMPWLLLLGPAIALWQAQEFGRRGLYARGSVSGALAVDAVAYGLQAIGTIALYRMGNLSGLNALILMMAGQAAGAVVGYALLRPHLRLPGSFRLAVEHNRSYASDMLPGNLTLWASEQVYPFFAGGMLGVQASGVLRALQNIVALSYVLSLAMEAVLTPRAAAVYAKGGHKALSTFLARLYMVSMPVIGGYLLLVAIFAEPLLKLLYKERYSGNGTLLAVMCLTYFLNAATGPVGTALRAKEITKPLKHAYMASTLLTFTLGLWATSAYGLWGTQVGRFANVIVLNVMFWRAWIASGRAGDDHPRGGEPEHERVPGDPHLARAGEPGEGVVVTTP